MPRDANIAPFRVMDLVAKAKEYPNAIHFEIGEPDLPPSPRVTKALQRAVTNQQYSYTPTLGLLELRQKIAEHYRYFYKVAVDIEQILITPGTSIAFMVAYQLLLQPNQRLGISDPSYPCYKNFAYMVDATPIFIPVSPRDNYMLNTKDIQSANVDVVHISSPSNPTGTIYSSKRLKDIALYCKNSNIGFISDELYHGLVYSSISPSTAIEFSSEAIVINGFSKYFCMPGMRIGWMILPKRLIRRAEIIAQNLYISAPTLSQYAALEAFDYDYLEGIKDTFRARRDFLYTHLSRLFDIQTKPEGAFYLWCDISKYSNNSLEFANRVLKDIQVAITPGIDFGIHQTDRFVRFSYTKDISHLKEGVERLKRYLQ